MTRPLEKLTHGLLDEAARLADKTAAKLRAVAGEYANRTVRPVPRLRHSIEDITWFHSINLGDGRITPGIKSVEQLAAETDALNLPSSLRGQSVLDIGAWDGYFAFESERRGAARVVALDHYAWSFDQLEYQRYHTEAKREGKVPEPPEQVSSIWDPVALPGRAGFDFARWSLGSSVEAVVGDFMTMDLATLGGFDIVLFLGVLYHLKDPFLALRRLRQVTRYIAVIETAGVVLPGWSDDKLWMFLEATELNDDPSNWWVPTSAGLISACRAAGFRDARVILEPYEYSPPILDYPLHYGRITVHALA
jgi:tRNA (mo5U34)-methyltransferase